MPRQTLSSRKWNKVKLYALYWVGYLLLFTLVEGSTDHDFINVFRNELISLAPKALFVWLVIEKISDDLLIRREFARFIAVYILLMIAFAFLLRLTDNYIILRYFLIYWAKEPLLSAAPFLYNIIKLQFLLTIPFCVKLYRYLNAEKNRMQQMQPVTDIAETQSLIIKCERRMVNLVFDDVYYVEAQGNYLEIFTVNGAFRTYLSISEMEEKLPATKFARIHRSFIVALNKIESHNHSQVIIKGKKLPIGRSYIPGIKRSFSMLDQYTGIVSR